MHNYLVTLYIFLGIYGFIGGMVFLGQFVSELKEASYSLMMAIIWPLHLIRLLYRHLIYWWTTQ